MWVLDNFIEVHDGDLDDHLKFFDVHFRLRKVHFQFLEFQTSPDLPNEIKIKTN